MNLGEAGTRMFRIAASITVAVATLSASVSAQNASTDSVFRSIRPGRELRIVTGSGEVAGRFARLNGAVVWLDTSAGMREIPGATIQQVRVKGNAAVKGAVIGGIAAFTAGAVFGYVLGANVACEPVDGGDCSPFEVAAVVGGLAGLGGAGVGALIGSQITVWRVRF